MVRAWASDHMSAAGWAVEQRTRPRAPSPSTDDGTSGTLRPPARLVCAASALALFQDSNSRPVHRSIRCKGMEWENVPPQKELMHDRCMPPSASKTSLYSPFGLCRCLASETGNVHTPAGLHCSVAYLDGTRVASPEARSRQIHPRFRSTTTCAMTLLL